MRSRWVWSASVCALALAGCAGRGGVDTVTVVAGAEEALTATSYRFTVDVGGIGLPFTGTLHGEVDAASHRVRLTTSTAGLDIVTIADGSDMYLQMPSFPGLPKVTGWTKVSGPRPDDATWNPLPFVPVPFADPADALAGLASARDAERVGEEDIAGTPTVHYVVTSAVAAPSLGPIDAWVDGDGRLRRATFALPDGLFDTSDAARLTVTVEFSDYGAPIVIDLPDPATVQTIDLSSMSGSLGLLPTDGSAATLDVPAPTGIARAVLRVTDQVGHAEVYQAEATKADATCLAVTLDPPAVDTPHEQTSGTGSVPTGGLEMQCGPSAVGGTTPLTVLGRCDCPDARFHYAMGTILPDAHAQAVLDDDSRVDVEEADGVFFVRYPATARLAALEVQLADGSRQRCTPAPFALPGASAVTCA
jgi:hypothetical protein